MYKERAILAAISSAKDELVSPEEYELNVMGDFSKKKIALAYKGVSERAEKEQCPGF